ncbi:hypothetical protein ACGF7W_24695 [Streptomyces sp. NPDC048219]|uniref:hypothetical protein n=1 Tax=unclassified Streptomyces TaxID=2593676 RepID=UPI00341740B3
MPGDPAIVVYPPAQDGGRRVRLDDAFIGLAYTLVDIAEFLRRAGLEDVEASDVEAARWIEWRGGGPHHWTA